MHVIGLPKMHEKKWKTFRNKTCLHNSNPVFSRQSRLASFLSAFQPFRVTAVWPTYSDFHKRYFESLQKHIKALRFRLQTRQRYYIRMSIRSPAGGEMVPGGLWINPAAVGKPAPTQQIKTWKTLWEYVLKRFVLSQPLRSSLNWILHLYFFLFVTRSFNNKLVITSWINKRADNRPMCLLHCQIELIHRLSSDTSSFQVIIGDIFMVLLSNLASKLQHLLV